MFKQWKPGAYYQNLTEVPAEEYYSQGFRMVLLDIDNTLQIHGSHQAGDFAKEQIKRFQDVGFEVVILSNAIQSRAESFGQSLPVKIIGSAGKPGTKGVEEALEQFKVGKNETVLIGDQLFTDIWSGIRAEVPTILVDRLSSKEPWYIHLKRVGEKIVKAGLKIRNYYDKNLTE